MVYAGYGTAEKAGPRKRALWRRLFVGEYGVNGFAIVLLAVAAMALLAGGGVALGLSIDRASCHQEGSTAGVAVKYKAMSDTCYVKIDGGWIPDSAWVHNTGN